LNPLAYRLTEPTRPPIEITFPSIETTRPLTGSTRSLTEIATVRHPARSHGNVSRA
jgi:hypothetical protein